jgi:hypothetical protein
MREVYFTIESRMVERVRIENLFFPFMSFDKADSTLLTPRLSTTEDPQAPPNVVSLSPLEPVSQPCSPFDTNRPRLRI